MSEHQRLFFDAGNGYTEPRESWIECSCGALIWAWQQFYQETTEDPGKAWADHLKFARGDAS